MTRNIHRLGQAAALLAALVVLAGCEPPPELADAWNRVQALRATYETCQRHNPRQPAVCAQQEAAYRAAVRSYQAQLDARQKGMGR
jgi:hypothetical protein